MGERKWTPEQLAAITTTGRSLLVSAAAGSGKTAVLTERCVRLVCEGGCDVDQVLVVTFTEAAAAEMRGRIEEALRKRLAQSPDDRLRRQFALIEQAAISTLHGFCLRLLRQHFHRAGLDPDFRVLDNDEAKLLRNEIVRDVFLDRYDADSAAFAAFVDAYGEGDDAQLMRQVVQVSELLKSLIDPEGWMRASCARIEHAAGAALEESELGRQWLESLHESLRDLRSECQAAIDALVRLPGLDAYVGCVRSIEDAIGEWAIALESGGYDTLVNAAFDFQMPRLPSVPKSNTAKEVGKALVDAVRAQVRDWIDAGPRFTSSEWQAGLSAILPHARVFLDLVREFDERYRQRKQSLRAVDFTDLERQALALLNDVPPVSSPAEGTASGNDSHRSPGCTSGASSEPTVIGRSVPPVGAPAALRPSPIARQLHRQYQHVLVDEYQDINEVQDAILSLASREFTGGSATPNLFCVGDVKQSIYSFRLAEPTRFLARRKRFLEDGSAGQVIDLQANFRSRAPLLEAINHVFRRLMTKIAADIEYDDSQELRPGAQFPPAVSGSFLGAPVELHLMPPKLEVPAEEEDDEENGNGDSRRDRDADSEEVELERSEREALLIANRIDELMGRGGSPRRTVVDRGPDGSPVVRPIEYRDIVILLRAMRFHADRYAGILRRRGIPAFNAEGAGYFDAMEIRDILSLLRLLDNQRQDIPLAAVLRSPLAGLAAPEDALARIRATYGDEVAFHDAVPRYAAEQGDELSAQLRAFLDTLAAWRDLARQRPVADVLWTIFEDTGYLAFCSGLENGPQRCANLIKLHERARQFGAFSRQGVYRFVRFLEAIQEEDDASQAPQLSEAEDVVRIMSIHKSKGLEFPVVIVPEMGKRLNFQGCSGRIVADREAHLGLMAADLDRRIRYPSLASLIVSQRLKRQNIAEELRVLYVAMTRAREHLILIGACNPGGPDRWSRRWHAHPGAMPDPQVLRAQSMLDWIGPVSAMLGGDASPHIRVYDHPAAKVLQWVQSLQASERPDAVNPLAELPPLDPPPATDSQAAAVIERITWAYPHSDLAAIPAAQSVTLLTKSRTPASSSGDASPLATELPLPRCLQEASALSAADRGSAIHLFLEHLDFARPCTLADLAAQRQELVARRILSVAEAKVADLDLVRWFLETELGRLIRARAAVLLREFPVNFPLDTPAADPLDRPMVRGRIDLLIPDSGGFILLDYKSDHVPTPEALAARVDLYRPQLALYKEALTRITSLPVHAAHLAFLSARKIVTTM